MSQKLRIGIVFGGRSGEHEVSLLSARSILSVLDPNQYEITQIGITHAGLWFSGAHALDALTQGKTDGLTPVTILPEPGKPVLYARRSDAQGIHLDPVTDLDVVFPILHGTYGEDGTLQGLLEMAGIAYVGAGVLASSVGMDKALFKDVMLRCGIPVAGSITTSRRAIETDLQAVIAQAEQVGDYPLFVKPANLGSSVGVTKCRTRSDLLEGLLEAARFDRRVLIERGVNNTREFEVSVLGNLEPKASLPGEVLPGTDFYTYAAKYLDDSSQLLIPAPLDAATTIRLQDLAVQAYQAIDGAGMARVDFLMDRATNEIFVSEINTIPGFTRISMYPKLWEASGLPYPALVQQLIELALERKSDQDRTEHQYRRDA